MNVTYIVVRIDDQGEPYCQALTGDEGTALDEMRRWASEEPFDPRTESMWLFEVGPVGNVVPRGRY